ncbi:glutamine-hydrolyzing GMP synthase [Mesoplasma lactucae]|uniref:GMP synthase [glutamine-hydrolyzing] n=1 Tax=Mesoplasma lactucae ATCC 49193 TaxID=81460 RepID=A0A291IRB3_9MOLU|nr:glutamine-hydrolyzing GMP synthase [Mesoplasma lactucae]ATG97274.1 glutamine-hydrolyzing GMP synthase [Mesoplasma lactucae ATCC 49193]ATZ20276.1 GMP synthase [Mesoplasma lactucae ATCC 49193]MCL8216447.1 GMP synthase [glutamine-hydrolyzing] [Mesoplasma lactucae ATCC 49193]
MKQTQIIILDYGSQYTQLLARRVRDLHVLAEVVPHNLSAEEIKKEYPNLKGIILSGGPASVYDDDAYTVDTKIFDMNLPILGVCYGLQLITHLNGGKVEKADKQEFGKAHLIIDEPSDLFLDVPKDSLVWMSHADHITKMPTDYIQLAHSDNSISAIKHQDKDIYGIQFHGEVTHSEYGVQMIKNFVFNICQAKEDWFMAEFIKDSVKSIKETVGDDQVILGLSGGVDSSVTAALINQAIGKQLTCIFVDTGLLRLNEGDKVMKLYHDNFDMNVIRVNAEDEFLDALKGVEEPEAKRKIIGKLFTDIFAREAKKFKNAKFLAQGTIYPDVIESSRQGSTSKVIKSHHNVGGLPEDLNFTLLEPLRELFKDEVRRVGLELGIPKNMIYRHPFPGPGLGIRVIGEVTKEKCDILRQADDIFISMLEERDLYDKVSQAFVTLLPVKTVGVMGDNRTYEYVCALRSVNTIDFMTATISHFEWSFLEEVVNRIINEVSGINRVTYDITSKPPGTIEWE